ncbi:MAG: cupin protein [Flaviaesturariibacter sp.]|nr:cupin protein [Flaviaesturariibacter sp.]
MRYRVSLADAKAQLARETTHPFTLLLQHGTMTVEFFAPQRADTQQPHRQDELYIVASGHAMFNRDGERLSCNKGDLLFVPAGMKHHFEQFSNDFAAWVVFYGADGGEPGR